MTKRRLPPMEPGCEPMFGRDVRSFAIGSWCPTPDGTGPSTAVAIAIELASGEHLVLRLKTPAAVDDVIQALLRHKRDVWPAAP